MDFGSDIGYNESKNFWSFYPRSSSFIPPCGTSSAVQFNLRLSAKSASSRFSGQVQRSI
jgi:hypothetical protein